jgi:hypothetical protein
VRLLICYAGKQGGFAQAVADELGKIHPNVKIIAPDGKLSVHASGRMVIGEKSEFGINTGQWVEFTPK